MSSSNSRCDTLGPTPSPPPSWDILMSQWTPLVALEMNNHCPESIPQTKPLRLWINRSCWQGTSHVASWLAKTIYFKRLSFHTGGFMPQTSSNCKHDLTCLAHDSDMAHHQVVCPLLCTLDGITCISTGLHRYQLVQIHN